MRFRSMPFLPCQTVPMAQRFLGFDNGGNGLFPRALLHLGPEYGGDIDILDCGWFERHYSWMDDISSFSFKEPNWIDYMCRES